MSITTKPYQFKLAYIYAHILMTHVTWLTVDLKLFINDTCTNINISKYMYVSLIYESTE